MTWGIYNEDLPEFSFDKGENISRYLEIFTKLYNDDIAYDWHTRQGFAGETDIFTNSQALFCLGGVYYASLLRDMKDDFGIIPYPKYDETQPSYYSVIGNAFTIYTVFSDFDQRGDKEQTLSMFTAILECWASEGYRKTTPIVFELNMQLKYSETQDETDMCEYVRAGIVFDLGRILDAALANVSMDGSVISAAESNADWTSTYSAHYESAQNNLAEFIKALNPTA